MVIRRYRPKAAISTINAPIKILRWSNGVFFDPARSMSDRSCWRPYRTGLPDATATMPGNLSGLRDMCLYGIYFVDFHLYVAVTLMKFPVWLQDGKWPPEGKLSSSSISPRGFFCSDRLSAHGEEGPAWRVALFCVLSGVALCLATRPPRSRATSFLRPRAHPRE